MPDEELVDLKFRLFDGSDLGPFRYASNSTIDMLKQRVLSDWPKGKPIIPKGVNEIKLISSGKILENNKTVGQCKAPFSDLPGAVIIMHVVVQPSPAKSKTGNFFYLQVINRLMSLETKRRLIMDQKRLSAHVPFCEYKV
ncbi:hypothetical protein ACFE04_027584 [Oxalis oulophora]